MYVARLFVATMAVLTGVPAAIADNTMSGEALYRDVAKYDGFGVHRTGTPGDRATSKWVAKELEDAGFEVRLDAWQLRQYDLDEASLTVGGERIDCFPFWYPHDTGEEPLEAVLARLDEGGRSNALRGRIAYTEMTGFSAGLDLRGAVDRAARAGAIGLIVMVPGPSGEPIAQNAPAPHNQEPHAIPAVIVGQKSARILRLAAAERAKTRLVIRGRDVPDAESSNVIGELRRGEKWIVITTPLSGWFTCAGERGPGVALFLGLARWAAARDGEHSWMFLGNTGHELDQIGAHQTLEDYAPPVEEVSMWIHLGASITARAYAEEGGSFVPLDTLHDAGNLVGSPVLGPLLDEAFADVEGLTPRTTGRVAGELRDFMNAGYTAYGFFGAFHYFHPRLDTGEVTTPALLEAVGAAIVKTLEAID